jgi:hypothetical protein
VNRGASTGGGGGSKCLFYSTKSCHEGIRTWGGARGRGGVNCGRRSKFVDDVMNWRPSGDDLAWARLEQEPVLARAFVGLRPVPSGADSAC